MASIETKKSIDWNNSSAVPMNLQLNLGSVLHERQLRQHGLTREAVQSAVRIAATVHAVARVLESSGGEQLSAAA